jgi:hypothetical protein
MRILIALLFSTLFLANVSHADSLKRADKGDIDMLLNAASGVNSAYWASYIGKARGRVYIQYESAVHSGSLFSEKMSHVIYWLPENEITVEKLSKLIEYKSKYESTK